MGSTGLSSQIGWGVESTPGTPVTVTRFFELNSESIKMEREQIFSKAMRTGRRTKDKWVFGRRSGSGDVEYEVMPNGFGAIPGYLIGGTPATTTPGGATNARLHTTKVGALDGKSRTVQVGRPNIGGTVDPFTYAGAKVTDWELSMEAGSDGLLMLKESLDVMDEATATALETASYPSTNVLFPWSDANITATVNGVSYPIKKLTIGGQNALKTDRYKLGQPTKLEALEGEDTRSYPIMIDMESYQGLGATHAHALWVAGTEVPIVATFTGPIIEAALRYMVRVTLQRCIFSGETPTVSGPDLLEQSVPGEALYTTHANTEIMFEVQNTDVAA